MPRPKVVCDPGHGGSDPGAVSTGGVRESDLNLKLALRFKALAALYYQFDVSLLRAADLCMSLADRAKLANDLAPSCVLSFHCNAAGTPQASGFEVFTTPGQTLADPLATHIYEEMDKVAPYPGRSDYDDGDPDKEARFYVLRNTAAPAVLIEFGFMTNPGDLAVLQNEAEQDGMLQAVCEAVTDWLMERGVQ